MRLIEKLEQIAYEEKLNVYQTDLHSCDGLIADDVIVLKSGLKPAQKTCILAEEIGHYYTGGGDTVRTKDNFKISRAEERAFRKATKLTLSANKIFRLLAEGLSLEEIAETCSVTADFILKAIQYWQVSGWPLDEVQNCTY